MNRKIRRVSGLILSALFAISSAQPQQVFGEVFPEEVSGRAYTAEQLEVHPTGYRSVSGMEVESLSDLPEDLAASAYGADTLEATYIPANGALPPLRDQSPFGTCWAHSCMALAESSMRKQGYRVGEDLSELHLAWFSYNTVTDPLGGTEGDANYAMNGSYRMSSYDLLNLGGNLSFAQNILAGWLGAADEATVPYPTDYSWSYDPSVDSSLAYVDEAILTDYYNVNMRSASDRNAVKRLIRDYGAVGISFYALNSYAAATNSNVYNGYNNCYYDPRNYGTTNHAVTVVGWDDTFSRSNFSTDPGSDGAWLVRNSWMANDNGNYYDTDNQDYSGYFWMSYANSSIDPLVYAFRFAPADTYDHNYQYDGSMESADFYMNQGDSVTVANVFTAQGDEELKAASFATSSTNVTYTIDIYSGLSSASNPQSGTKAATVTGSTTYAGYFTVPLPSSVELSQGERFSVVVTLQKSGSRPMITMETSTAINAWYRCYGSGKSGQSFYQSGSSWVDNVARGSHNFRIKAFTVDQTVARTPIYPSVSMEGWTYGETGNEPVLTGNPGNGTVTFTYYTNEDCTSLTTPSNSGAVQSGGKPKFGGTWYLKASVAAAGGYASGSATASFRIEKAKYTEEEIKVDTEVPKTAKTGGKVVLPELADQSSYSSVEVDDPRGIFTSTPTVQGTTLTYNTGNSSPDDTATVVITASGRNYQDYTVTVSFTVVDLEDEDIDLEDDEGEEIESRELTLEYGSAPKTLTTEFRTQSGSLSLSVSSSSSNSAVASASVNTESNYEGWEIVTTMNLTITPISCGTATITLDYTVNGSIGQTVLEVTVVPKSVTITGVSAGDKTYDGGVKANLTGTPKVVGLVGDDTVTVIPGTAFFADPNVGTKKLVSFDGYAIRGNNKYQLKSQPASVYASITKAAKRTIPGTELEISGEETEVTGSAAGKMPEDAGTLRHLAGSPKTDGEVTVESFTVDQKTGAVRAELSGGKKGDQVTLPVQIESQNYETSTWKLMVTLKSGGTEEPDPDPEPEPDPDPEPEPGPDPGPEPDDPVDPEPWRSEISEAAYQELKEDASADGKDHLVTTLTPESNGELYTVTLDGKTIQEQKETAEGFVQRITSLWIGGFPETLHYTGAQIKPAVHVYDGVTPLTEKKDYTLTYTNNKNVGTARVKVSFKGNYSGVAPLTAEFTIAEAELREGSNSSEADLVALDLGVVISAKGKLQAVSPQVLDTRTGKLLSPKFFALTFADENWTQDPLAQGGVTEASVSPAKGSTVYAGSQTIRITAVSDKKNEKDRLLSGAKVSWTQRSYLYTGSEVLPPNGSFTLTSKGGEKLVEGRDYETKIYHNTEPGTAVAVFSAIPGNQKRYVGSLISTFQIKKGRALNSEGITISYEKEVPYRSTGALSRVTIRDGVRCLTEGVDYTVKYTGNKDLGNASLTITGKGLYSSKSSLTRDYTVIARDIEEMLVIPEDVLFIDDMKSLSPNDLKLTVMDPEGKKLSPRTDYYLKIVDEAFEKDGDVYGLSVYMYGTGCYSGERKDIVFPVIFGYEEPLSRAKANAIPSQLQTGGEVTLSNEVLSNLLYTGPKGEGVYLRPDTDFEVAGYQNNTGKGTAKVILRGIGDWTGVRTLSFKILPRSGESLGAYSGGDWQS